MSIEKKEVKSKKGNGLSKEKQDRVRTLSKIIYIVTRIFRVFTVIGIFCLLLGVVLTPVIVRNVKIQDGTISIFDMDLEYKYGDNNVDLLMGDVLIGSFSNEEKANFDLIISELEKTDVTRTFALIELALISSVAVMFICFFILKYIDMLFVNICKNETPFTNENSDYLDKIAYLTLITVIITLVSDIISSIFFKTSMIHISLSSVIMVLGLYPVDYIFEYACILQKNSKNKMYE